MDAGRPDHANAENDDLGRPIRAVADAAVVLDRDTETASVVKSVTNVTEEERTSAALADMTPASERAITLAVAAVWMKSMANIPPWIDVQPTCSELPSPDFQSK